MMRSLKLKAFFVLISALTAGGCVRAGFDAVDKCEAGSCGPADDLGPGRDGPHLTTDGGVDVGPLDCLLDGRVLKNGESGVFYSAPRPADYPDSCDTVAGLRSCQDGQLSGGSEFVLSDCQPYAPLFYDTFDPGAESPAELDANLAARTSGVYSVPAYRKGGFRGPVALDPINEYFLWDLEGAQLRIGGDSYDYAFSSWAGPDFDFAVASTDSGAPGNVEYRFTVEPVRVRNTSDWICFSFRSSAAAQGLGPLDQTGSRISIIFRLSGGWTVFGASGTVLQNGSGPSGRRRVAVRVKNDTMTLSIDGIDRGSVPIGPFPGTDYISFTGLVEDYWDETRTVRLPDIEVLYLIDDLLVLAVD